MNMEALVQHDELNANALSGEELEAVAGGLLYPVDLSQMPDRSVMCGTMWVLDQLLKRLTGRA
jgi:hypothetical protein